MTINSTDTKEGVIASIGELEAVVFEKDHIEPLSQWLSRDPDELFLTSSSLPYPCTVSDFEEFYTRNYKEGVHEFFSVYHSETKKHIGHFEIKNISAAFNCGTIAHVLLGDQDYRAKGLGKNFVQLMNCVGFDVLELFRLGLAVHVQNTSAVTAYIKGGYINEGVVREVLERDGQRISLYQMGLLSREWAQQRKTEI